MTSDTLPYSVPPEPGRTASITLAVLMHALLFAFLWFGIHWVSETPQSIDPDYVFTEQELNAPQPEPVPVPTPKVEDQTPPVPDPDIATAQEKKRLKEEQEEKKKLETQKKADEQRKQEELEQKEKEKRDAEKKQEEDKKLADKKQQADDQKKLQKLRDDEKARMMREAGGNPGASSPTVPGKQGTGDAAWIGKVQGKIQGLIRVIPGPGDNPNATAEFAVKLLPDGSVASVRRTKSSGIPAFDDAVERAINAAVPYPSNSSGVVPRDFTSSHRLGDQK